MICPNCGHKNKEDAIYCVECGTKLEIKEELEPVEVTEIQEDKETDEVADTKNDEGTTGSDPKTDEVVSEESDVTEEPKQEESDKVEAPVQEAPQTEAPSQEEVKETTVESQTKETASTSQLNQTSSNMDDTLDKEVTLFHHVLTVQDIATMICSLLCCIGTILPMLKLSILSGYSINLISFNFSTLLGLIIVVGCLLIQYIALVKKEYKKFIGVIGLVVFIAVIVISRKVSILTNSLYGLVQKGIGYYLLFIPSFVMLVFGALYTWKWSKNKK